VLWLEQDYLPGAGDMPHGGSTEADVRLCRVKRKVCLEDSVLHRQVRVLKFSRGYEDCNSGMRP